LLRTPRRFLRADVRALLAAAIALAAISARADEPPPAPAPAAGAPADITPPHLFAPISVQYPTGATGAASVVLRITVDKDGRIREARVLEGTEPFASAALASVDGARFEPATRGGQPIAATVRFRIDFARPSPQVPETPPASPPSNATTGVPTPTPTPAVQEVNVRGLKLDPAAQEPTTPTVSTQQPAVEPSRDCAAPARHSSFEQAKRGPSKKSMAAPEKSGATCRQAQRSIVLDIWKPDSPPIRPYGRRRSYPARVRDR